MLDFQWTQHGAERAKQRGITREDILDALNHPATQYPGDQPGKVVKVGRPNQNGTTVIVVTDPPSPQGVVTVVSCWVRRS